MFGLENEQKVHTGFEVKTSLYPLLRIVTCYAFTI